MSSLIDKINSGALALRDVKSRYGNLPVEAQSSFKLSKAAPYFGFVDVAIGDNPPFAMFSNNDDFVAKDYFWHGPDAYEPMSLRVWLALCKTSSVVIDIGAYTGVYSLVAASQNRKCKVHAFEANDVVYSRLLINKKANGLGNMNVYHRAVSGQDGMVEFNVFAGDGVLSTGSSIVDRDIGRDVHARKSVRSASLNDLVSELGLPRVDLIKIDTEGAEHLVFKGGEYVIEKCKPDILCEFFTGSRTEEISPVLSGMGYNFFRIHETTKVIEPLEKIVASDSLDSLNTLVTQRTHAQVSQLLEGMS